MGLPRRVTCTRCGESMTTRVMAGEPVCCTSCKCRFNPKPTTLSTNVNPKT